MFNSPLSDSDLLKEVLAPLLEDFEYWFQRSRLLLEHEAIPFLQASEQANLLGRVVAAQQEVATTKLLFQATNGQAGIEMAVLMPWHRLVTECWQVARRFRLGERSQQET
ncbi:MAG: DUF2605 domain-containing protein [Leptolyngbyaceae cyanobacterium]